jgi:hypothetical protein
MWWQGKAIGCEMWRVLAVGLGAEMSAESEVGTALLLVR